MGIHGQRVSIITDNLLLINPFKTCILFLDMHTFVCVSVCLSVCGYVYICMCTYVWIMAKDIEKTSDSLDLEPYSWKMPDVGVRNKTLVSGGKGNAIKFYSWPNYNHLYADNSWDSSKFLHFSSTKILKKRTWDSPLEIKKKKGSMMMSAAGKRVLQSQSHTRREVAGMGLSNTKWQMEYSPAPLLFGEIFCIINNHK